jgi:hypothetical protein
MMAEEQWRAVEDGYYEVSDRGRVRRAVAAQGTSPGRVLSNKGVNGFYPSIAIHKDGACCGRRRIHDLVALAFIGPKEPGMEVNHKNGDKTDNTLENLEYVTRKENAVHAYANGLTRLPDSRGSRNPNARLSEKDIPAIRRRVANGETYASVAQDYGVSADSVGSIVRRAGWRHV